MQAKYRDTKLLKKKVLQEDPQREDMTTKRQNDHKETKLPQKGAN